MATRRQNLPAEERRAVTVQAVIALAGERDPGDITTQSIADRMRLTQGALFRHFPSKDAIWEAAMDWAARRLLERITRASERPGSTLEALQAMFASHVEFVAEHPGVPRMLFGELQKPGETGAKKIVQVLIGRYGARLRSLIDAGKERGEISQDVDSAVAATLFIGTIQGLVMQSLLAGDVGRIVADAPGAFAIIRRGISRSP